MFGRLIVGKQNWVLVAQKCTTQLSIGEQNLSFEIENSQHEMNRWVIRGLETPGLSIPLPGFIKNTNTIIAD